MPLQSQDFQVPRLDTRLRNLFSRERFETPLAGGAAAPMRASAFCWHTTCQRRGGNPPAPAFARRGKRERGCSEFLVAAGSSRWHSANAGTPLGYCVLALVPCFSPFQSTNRYVDPLVPLSRNL